MQACLYSPRGGFYASRGEAINAHFGTSPTSHPVFGRLIARQLEQIWRVLGAPCVFHLIEVGAGDGALARSIVQACPSMDPAFAAAMFYVAADYEPRMLQSRERVAGGHNDTRDPMAGGGPDAEPAIRRVRSAGLGAFRNVVGCILTNELLDNFPVHRFAIRDGKVQEVYVTAVGGDLVEVLGDPSTPRIEARLASSSATLADGFRGEVNLALEDWTREIASALKRGVVLTIDYGQLAADLYAPCNSRGTMVCYRQHTAGDDPYRHLGQQDITCLVDFTALMRAGEQHGLATVGYALQREFLANLGFASCLAAIETQGLSAARTALNRMAMMALVDPQQYGDFKVLAQAKGLASDVELVGFTRRGS